MTQLMEGGNSTRPVPATQEIMDELPRTVLEEGSTCFSLQLIPSKVLSLRMLS